MTDRTIDLDALAAELTAAGWKCSIDSHTSYISLECSGDDGSFSVFRDGLTGWQGDLDWDALDIIRRHLGAAPAPAVDPDAVLVPRELADRLRVTANRYALGCTNPHMHSQITADSKAMAAILKGATDGK